MPQSTRGNSRVEDNKVVKGTTGEPQVEKGLSGGTRPTINGLGDREINGFQGYSSRNNMVKSETTDSQQYRSGPNQAAKVVCGEGNGYGNGGAWDDGEGEEEGEMMDLGVRDVGGWSRVGVQSSKEIGGDGGDRGAIQTKTVNMEEGQGIHPADNGGTGSRNNGRDGDSSRWTIFDEFGKKQANCVDGDGRKHRNGSGYITRPTGPYGVLRALNGDEEIFAPRYRMKDPKFSSLESFFIPMIPLYGSKPEDSSNETSNLRDCAKTATGRNLALIIPVFSHKGKVSYRLLQEGRQRDAVVDALEGLSLALQSSWGDEVADSKNLLDPIQSQSQRNSREHLSPSTKYHQSGASIETGNLDERRSGTYSNRGNDIERAVGTAGSGSAMQEHYRSQSSTEYENHTANANGSIANDHSGAKYGNNTMNTSGIERVINKSNPKDGNNSTAPSAISENRCSYESDRSQSESMREQEALRQMVFPDSKRAPIDSPRDHSRETQKDKADLGLNSVPDVPGATRKIMNEGTVSTGSRPGPSGQSSDGTTEGRTKAPSNVGPAKPPDRYAGIPPIYDQSSPAKPTKFSQFAISVLTNYFAVDNKPSPQKLTIIAEQTGLTRHQVRVWFQNKRARKDKQRRSHLQGSYMTGMLQYSNVGSNISQAVSDQFNSQNAADSSRHENNSAAQRNSVGPDAGANRGGAIARNPNEVRSPQQYGTTTVNSTATVVNNNQTQCNTGQSPRANMNHTTANSNGTSGVKANIATDNASKTIVATPSTKDIGTTSKDPSAPDRYVHPAPKTIPAVPNKIAVKPPLKNQVVPQVTHEQQIATQQSGTPATRLNTSGMRKCPKGQNTFPSSSPGQMSIPYQALTTAKTSGKEPTQVPQQPHVTQTYTYQIQPQHLITTTQIQHGTTTHYTSKINNQPPQAMASTQPVDNALLAIRNTLTSSNLNKPVVIGSMSPNGIPGRATHVKGPVLEPIPQKPYTFPSSIISTQNKIPSLFTQIQPNENQRHPNPFALHRPDGFAKPIHSPVQSQTTQTTQTAMARILMSSSSIDAQTALNNYVVDNVARIDSLRNRGGGSGAAVGAGASCDHHKSNINGNCGDKNVGVSEGGVNDTSNINCINGDNECDRATSVPGRDVSGGCSGSVSSDVKREKEPGGGGNATVRTTVPTRDISATVNNSGKSSGAVANSMNQSNENPETPTAFSS